MDPVEDPVGAWLRLRQDRAALLAVGVLVTTLMFVIQARITHYERLDVEGWGRIVFGLVAVLALTCWSNRSYGGWFVIGASLAALLALGSFGRMYWPLIMVAFAAIAGSAPRPDFDARPVRLIVGALIVSALLFTVTALLLVPVGSGHWEDVPVAGNRVQYFLGDVQQGRSTTITGGVDDPLGSAYRQLCAEVRSRVSEGQFRVSQGEAVSPVLSASSEAGSRHGDRYIEGVDVEHTDTMDQSLMSTWVNVDFYWYTSARINGQWTTRSRTETWRVDLVREDGRWRVCGFIKR